MKTIEVAKATNEQLNWLVAKCECPNDVRDGRPTFWLHPNNNKLVCRQTYNHAANPKGYELCHFSTNPAQMQPIIEREHISTNWLGTHWQANVGFDPESGESDADEAGHTCLVAAARCYVVSKLGDEVEVPEGLE